MFFAESLLARSVCTRSFRVHGWQPGPKTPGARFSEKTSFSFEIHRTSETSKGSAAL